MKVAVRYCTRSGNTKKVADAIAEEAHVKAEDIEVPLPEDVDLLFLGSSLYGMDVDKRVYAFFNENTKKIGELASFGTAASPASSIGAIEKLCNQHDIPMAEESFRCYGSFGMIHKDRPNEEDLKDAKAFAKRVLKAAK